MLVMEVDNRVRALWAGSSDEYSYETPQFNDWGTLVIDGDPANTWFTLTATEWTYLLTGRDTRDGITRRVNVNITDVPNHPTGSETIHGCMLFPDDWTTDRIPSGITLSTTSINTISYTDFRRLEAVGCVLLPQCGYRDWGGFHNNWQATSETYGTGYYWTATYIGETNDEEESYMMVYTYHADRYAAAVTNSDGVIVHGCAVRLVKPAPGYTYANANRQGPSSNK